MRGACFICTAGRSGPYYSPGPIDSPERARQLAEARHAGAKINHPRVAAAGPGFCALPGDPNWHWQWPLSRPAPKKVRKAPLGICFIKFKLDWQHPVALCSALTTPVLAALQCAPGLSSGYAVLPHLVDGLSQGHVLRPQVVQLDPR
jgi:hypothetical protein